MSALDSARARGWVAGGIALLLPLALYVRTLAPTVYGVDSADLTTAAYLLGIAHPPGAPAYLLVAHAFTWLPIGDVGYRVNLVSAVAGALASLGLARAIARLSGSVALGLAGACATAASYYVWTASIAAELYAMQGAVVMALVVLALRWRESRQPAWWYGGCLLAGVGLGVHLSLVLTLPGLAALALTTPDRPWRRGRLLVGGALCGLLGAAVYAYLPLRSAAALPLNPARAYWHIDLTTWGGLWWMVSGAGFRRELFAAPIGRELATFAFRLWSNFLGAPALLGLIGLGTGLRRAPAIHGSLLLMLAGHLAFYLSYGAPDKETMFVPAYLLWGMWMALGARDLAAWAAGALGIAAPARVAAAALAVLAALLVLVNWPLVDASDDWSARERGDDIVRTLAPNAVFVGAWPDVRLVEYLQYVEGYRPDLELVDTFFSSDAERGARIAAALDAGRPVYVSTCRDLPRPEITCEYDATCDCHRLRAPGNPSAN